MRKRILLSAGLLNVACIGIAVCGSCSASAQATPDAGGAAAQAAPNTTPPATEAQQPTVPAVDTSVSSGSPSRLIATVTYPPFPFPASLAPQLSAAATPILDGCELHLPLGYAPQAMPLAAALQSIIKVQAFAAAPNPDGFAPFLEVATAAMPAGKYDLNAVLHGALIGEINHIKQDWQDVAVAQPTFGMINNIPFARVYYKGIGTTLAGAPIPKRGFTYLCFDAAHSQIVLIRANDSQAYGAASMPIAEASVMTFDIRPPLPASH